MSDIDVNAIADTLNSKVDLADGANQASVDYVVESQYPTAENNYTWYRLYKSGWVEQGGVIGTSSTYRTVNLLKSYNDTNYTLTIAYTGTITDTSNMAYNSAMIAGKTESSFQAGRLVCSWQASGMSA